ncbi:rod shape-determining protein MreD [Trichlorobacter ammonificans]|uniref:Rod shape-determining protein MreD n=1 Tax=Trichlorobacter ammonificans TaxID=2916410 RepID=A0ABM9D8H5_9BACT|nr:rod shape-determining protein MreD [Trichlorobacter ammonificans]CAH2030689.1 Rod shape-determining protein MreD [Trichlorobacter ammonificans]
MNDFLKGALLILLTVLLQTSVLPQYLAVAYKPDLLLVLVVYLALRAPVGVSLPAAYGLGLLKDSLGGIYLGMNGFSFLVVYLVLKALSDRLYVQSAILFVLTVSVATVSVLVINLLLLVVFSQGGGLIASMLANLAPHLLMNAFVASLITALPFYSRPWNARC